MKFKIFFIGLFLLLAGCASSNPQPHKEQKILKVSLFTMNNSPEIGQTISGQKIKLGGFSGLQYLRSENNALYFQTITDRGPNGEMKNNERPFLLPEFSPEIVALKADLTTRELSVVSETKLKKKNAKNLSGLPNVRTEENPIDIFGLAYSIDAEGLDTEGMTPDDENGWWLADEYGPSLVHIDHEGVVLRRLMPSLEIPKMYADRKTNRGFEGVFKDGQKIYGILQSPLKKEENFARILEIDLETMKTSAEYFYPFQPGNDKVGDAVSLKNKSFLILEQNGKIGEKSQKYIYKITLNETDENVTKTLIADLKNTPFNNIEKVEGLTVIDQKRIALVYDNDFQINGDTNFKTGFTPLNESKNQLMILEFSENFF